MAIKFPVGAGVGTEFSSSGVTWKYDGEKWVSQTTATEGDSVFRYQEGTWTPVMEQNVAPFSTYTGFTGVTSKWTRVGNIVTLYARFINASPRPADATPEIDCVGLPYKSATGIEPVGATMFQDIAGTYGSISAYVDPSSVNPAHSTGRIIFYKTTAGASWDSVKVQDLTDTTSGLIFVVTYITEDTTFAVPAGIGATVTIDEKAGGSGGSSEGGASVSTGPNPPSDPSNGDLWYDDTDTMRLYIYFDDGDSSQWVDASPAQDGLWISDGTTISPTKDGNNLKVVGDITANSYNTGQLAGFRNLLINSNFYINQRGRDPLTGDSSRPYFVDRWRYAGVSQTCSISADPWDRLGTKFITITPSGAGSLSGLMQGIELDQPGSRAPFISGATYTFSFYTTTTEEFYVNIATADDTAFTNETGAKTFTKDVDLLQVGSSGAFIRYACNFTVDEPAETNICLTVQIWSRTGAQWNITAPQLEIGSVATPLEQIPIQTQLANCQRYFLRGAFFSSILYTAEGATMNNMSLPVSMRTTPTVTVVPGSPLNDIIYATKDGLFTQANLTGGIGNVSLHANNSVLYCTTGYDNSSWNSGPPNIGDACFVRAANFNIDAEF